MSRRLAPEPDETDRIEWFPPGEVRKLLRDGQIVDGPSLTAVSCYLALLNGAR
jgi:hypothetical protein